MRTLNRLIKTLGVSKQTVAVILGLHLVGTIFEAFGLAILLPVFEFMRAAGEVRNLARDLPFWRGLFDAFETIGVPLRLDTLLLVSFICILCRLFFAFARSVYMSRVQESIVMDVRNRGFENYLHAPMAYVDRQPLGQVVNDLTTELQRAVGTVFFSIMLMGYGLLTVVYVGVLFSLSAAMTLVALIAIAVASWSLRHVFSKTEQTGRVSTEANQQMSAFLVERLRAVRLVRLSGTERAEMEVMAALGDRQRNHLVRLAKLLARTELTIEPVIVGIGLLLLYVGIQRFNLRIEEIGLFLIIVLRLIPSTKEIMRLRQNVLGGMGSLEAVERRLVPAPEISNEKDGSIPFVNLRDKISLLDVSFEYEGRGDTPALDGVTLEIPAGTITALVGPSGSGKSTTIDLLPRLREPVSGQILFDGIPQRQYSVSSLRAAIAYVPQTPQIFNVTIAQHIRYGKYGATEHEIREAARLAGASDFIESLPRGYDTMVGEGAIHLSGGQRQRLDLARALIRNAPILILDEPMSNLDADSEVALRKALRAIHRATRKTIIIVGHRLITVADADRIVVMKHGRIEAVGTHQELMEHGSWYAQAFKKQQTENIPSREISGLEESPNLLARSDLR